MFKKGVEEPDFKNPQTIIQMNKPRVFDMIIMLETCGLELVGKHHSGIDDSKNLAAIAIHLMKKDFVFTQGMVCKDNWIQEIDEATFAFDAGKEIKETKYKPNQEESKAMLKPVKLEAFPISS